MTFQPGRSGNPAGRPRGSVNRLLAMLREAVEQVLPLVVERALAGDAEAQKLILERGLPKLKPVEIPIEFTLPAEGTTSPARTVLLQAAEGGISLPYAKDIISGLIPVVQQEEKTVARKSDPLGQFTNAYIYGLTNK